TFNAETQERQQELMKAWLSLGATYKEGNGKLVNSDSRGLAGNTAVGHHHDNKTTNMSTQPTEGREAELAANSLAGLEPGNYAGSSASGASSTTKHHDQHAANANRSGHYVP
ncbi:hypothetical protein Gpo141_00009038, partial [Globisporangium polare]